MKSGVSSFGYTVLGTQSVAAPSCCCVYRSPDMASVVTLPTARARHSASLLNSCLMWHLLKAIMSQHVLTGILIHFKLSFLCQRSFMISLVVNNFHSITYHIVICLHCRHRHNSAVFLVVHRVTSVRSARLYTVCLQSAVISSMTKVCSVICISHCVTLHSFVIMCYQPELFLSQIVQCAFLCNVHNKQLVNVLSKISYFHLLTDDGDVSFCWFELTAHLHFYSVSCRHSKDCIYVVCHIDEICTYQDDSGHMSRYWWLAAYERSTCTSFAFMYL